MQGAIGRKIPYWFDVILHLCVESDGTRKPLTHRQMVGDKSYFAGDHYNVFRDNSYVLNFDRDSNIVPASIIGDVIAKTIGGSRLDHDEERRKEVKEAWIEFAIQCKLVASRADKPGIDRLKAAMRSTPSWTPARAQSTRRSRPRDRSPKAPAKERGLFLYSDTTQKNVHRP